MQTFELLESFRRARTDDHSMWFDASEKCWRYLSEAHAKPVKTAPAESGNESKDEGK